MENSDLITNRFSPGNPNPVFFAGRKQESMQILLHLQNFRHAYSGSCPPHILILKGEDGVGKTTFLQRLKKQVQEEINYFIPVFSSIYQLVQNPNSFYKNFFGEIEKAISSSSWRREASARFFKQQGWSRIAAKISPSLASVAAELAAMEGKISALRSFFKVVPQVYQSATDLREILLFSNWFLEASDMFLLWLVDDFEQLKTAPELLEIIIPALAEIEKYQRRQLLVLALESKEMAAMVSSFQSSQDSGLEPLLHNNSLISIDSERQLPAAIENLSGYLNAWEKLVLVNIAPELDRKKITTSLKNRCAAQFTTTTIGYSGDTHIECLAQWSDKLIAAVEQLLQNNDSLRQLVFVQSDMVDSCRRLQQELALQREFSSALAIFTQMLAQLDKQLQKLPQARLVVFIENFEKWLGPEGESSKRITSFKSRRGDMLLYKSRFTLPTICFVELFNALNRSIHAIASLILVPVTSLQEFATAFTLENKARQMFGKSPTFELKPLAKYDAIHMLKETAARSRVMLTSDIAVDIYNRFGGLPLHLQYFGYQLLAELEATIPSPEIDALKESLLEIYDALIHGSNSRLQEGPDGRVRLALPADYYENQIPDSIDEFYRLLLKKIRSRLGRDIIEKLCEGPLSPAALLAILEQKHQGITEADVLAQIESMKAINLLEYFQGQAFFLHSWLKDFVKNLFEQKKSVAAEANKKITRAITRQRLQPTTANLRTRRLMPGSISPQLAPGPGKDLLIAAISWSEKGQVPSRNLLNMLSPQISLNESKDKFRDTMRYIYSLCSLLIRKLELCTDVGQAIALFKEHLSNSQNEHGLDLYSALHHTFLSKQAHAQIEQDQDYYLLSKFYLVTYAITSDSDSRDQAAAAFWQAFTRQPASEGLYRLSLEIEDIFSETASVKKTQKAHQHQQMLQAARRLLCLEKCHERRYLQQELTRLVPTHLPKEFHEHFVGYLQKLIATNCGLRQCALEVLGLYGHIAHENQQLLEQVTRLTQKAGAVGRAALTALLRLFPYLSTGQKQQVIVVLEEAVMHHPDNGRRLHILQILSQCPLLYGADELAEFFYGVIKNEGDVTVNVQSWAALARVKKMCSEDFQQEISAFLLEYYQQLLPKLSYAGLLPHTEILLHSYDEVEPLSAALDQLLTVVLAKDEVLYCVQPSPLAWIYPLLRSSQKYRVRECLHQWLSSANSQKKLVALAHLSFASDSAEQASVLAEMPPEYLPALRRMREQLCEFVGALSPEAREVLWDKCLDLAALPGSGQEMGEQLREIPESALDIALAMAGYFSQQRTARLAELMVAAIDRGLSLPGSDNITYLVQGLPYFAAAQQQQILQKCRQRLVPGEATPEELAKILAILAWSQDAEATTDDGIVAWLCDELHAHPQLLLASTTAFFTRTWEKLADEQQRDICQAIVPYLCFSEYAEPTTVFLVKAKGDAPEFMRWAYIYQFAPSTCHLAFALYEIFPELLADTLWLEENYQRVRQQDPYWLGLKMANFHQRVGSDVRAQELSNWVVENCPSLIIKREALRQRRWWELQQNNGDQARQALEEIVRQLEIGR